MQNVRKFDPNMEVGILLKACIHATHQECPFNCLGDELITIYFSNVESSKHFVLTTFKGVKDMEEEISVQLDLMIIIPMTVNDPI